MRQSKAKLLRKFSASRSHYKKLKKKYMELNSENRRKLSLFIEENLKGVNYEK